MDEALKVLNNIRTLRAHARVTDLETLLSELAKRWKTLPSDNS